MSGRAYAFIVALLLSLALHLVALGSMQGFTSLAYSPRVLFVTSIERAESPAKASRSIKDLLGQGGRVVPGAPAAGEAGGRNSQTGMSDAFPDGMVEQPVVGPVREGAEESSDYEDGEGIEGAGQGKDEDGSRPDAGRDNPGDNVGIVRERIEYDIYWVGIYVGKASIGAMIDKGSVKITSEVHSAPFISNFYKVEDYAESVIIDGRPVSFRIRQHEGRYRSNKETLFDADGRKITYVDRLKNKTSEHAVKDPPPWDVISGFYHLRTQPLEVGTRIFIPVFDSNKFLIAEVDVLGKEKIGVFDRTERDTILVKPVLKSEGLFQKKGDVFIWLTDDETRIPVRVETEVPIGKVVARLRSITEER